MTDLIGHRYQRDLLRDLLRRGKLPHALIFTGPAGVGKFRVAREFANELLIDCVRHATDRSNAVTLAEKAQLPDLHLIQLEEGKKDIPVDRVRDLIAKLSLKPYLSRSSVAIIDTAEYMNSSAANALLKTLEEPSTETFLFLVTEAPHQLPETILSRCQQLRFGKLLDAEVKNILRSFGVSDSLAESLATLADGSLTELNLAPFIDPLTREVLNAEKMLASLEKLSADTEKIAGDLSELFQAPPSDRVGAALSLASQIAAETDRERYWQALRHFGRKRLITSSGVEARYYADQLQQILAAEIAIKERNANAALTLSSLFVAMRMGARPAPSSR